MTPEWITAIASLVTMVVIGASAIAALLQLRHMRGSNQIELIANWTEEIEADHFQNALGFIARELPALLAEPEKLRGLSWTLIPPELQAVRTVANHFEAVGLCVRRGIIDADVACDLWAYVVMRAWTASLPVATYARQVAGRDAVWENFEYLALLSQRWIDAHPNGMYPLNEPRMPKDDSLARVLSR